MWNWTPARKNMAIGWTLTKMGEWRHVAERIEGLHRAAEAEEDWGVFLNRLKRGRR